MFELFSDRDYASRIKSSNFFNDVKYDWPEAGGDGEMMWQETKENGRLLPDCSLSFCLPKNCQILSQKSEELQRENDII